MSNPLHRNGAGRAGIALVAGVWERSSFRALRGSSAQRAPDNAFAGRLLLTLCLVLALLGAASYLLFANTLSSSVVQAGEFALQADARSAELAYRSADGERPLDEVGELLEHLAARPHITGVELVNARGFVVYSDDPKAIGDHEPRAGAIARSGGSYAGEEREAHERQIDFEFVRALRLGGQRYALVVDQDSAVLGAQRDALKRNSLVLILVGLLAAIPLFYMLGGRKLIRMHRRAVNLATRDPLTGLGNPTEFREELDRALALATRHGEPLSVAVVDLDDFKLVNDRKGHRGGDRLLVGLAELLRGGRPEDRAFRIGGDEFALIFPRTTVDGAMQSLNWFRVAAAESLDGVTLSCGVGELDRTAPNAETMVEQADAAVYEAKRLGRDRVVSFSQLEDSQIVTGDQTRALHQLLAGPPPTIAFQPIWELADTGNRVLGFEALARPDTEGRLTPGDAFEIAERIGRSQELDALCRRAALARAHELPDDALLFLNVAPQSLDRDELAGDALVHAVRAAGLEPERVVLEITERTLTRLDRLVRDATRLRALGFKLALDDVGAGNAGLEMLKNLPVDFVKIDREIIANSSAGGTGRAILLAVMAYAAETGAYVIAEGIETEAMLEHVRHPPQRAGRLAHGVQGAQGYMLGRPSTKSPIELPTSPPAGKRAVANEPARI